MTEISESRLGRIRGLTSSFVHRLGLLNAINRFGAPEESINGHGPSKLKKYVHQGQRIPPMDPQSSPGACLLKGPAFTGVTWTACLVSRYCSIGEESEI
jgi:hypothetical protein